MDHPTTTEYTCPMHPEIVQSDPGSCPTCGMFLQPRESPPVESHGQAGMDHGSMDHGEMDHGKMDHDSMDHGKMDDDSMDHGKMDDGKMDHGEMAFMSMVDATKNLPRSSDDLQMDWIDVPFGPFFPGLPGGLMLTLTLDGDTVAGSSARALFENIDLPNDLPMDCANFVEQLGSMDPLAPISYRQLACLATENAAQIEVATDTTLARVGALERERITSHLNWLALFAQQTGFDWLLQIAASLQFRIQQADLQEIITLKPDIEVMIKRLQRTPLLKSRTVGIGLLANDAVMYGPVARASGKRIDARSTDETFIKLGFTPVYRLQGDAFARLQVRLDEIAHSLALIHAAGAIELPELADLGQVTGSGEAMVETPRGQACLRLTMEKGRVIAAQLDTPSTQHLTLIESLTEQQALGDALLVVGSLDLSLWEMRK